ncbi:hypothetical protein Zmor_014245 [Zophobas morio]|uniref:Uncharacterized protein n=1 Tax=Zophobas morio TaxID=2755281 RepID=A0AA38MG98_9CUCU|nr:hypothetical protein Zmor_014245 [Zophobas morio]
MPMHSYDNNEKTDQSLWLVCGSKCMLQVQMVRAVRIKFIYLSSHCNLSHNSHMRIPINLWKKLYFISQDSRSLVPFPLVSRPLSYATNFLASWKFWVLGPRCQGIFGHTIMLYA